MNTSELLGLLPVIVLAAAGVLVMLVIGFYRSHSLTAVLTAAGMILALGALWPALRQTPLAITPLLVMDAFAPFFIAMILLTCLAVVVISYGYLAHRSGRKEEYYLLLILVSVGAVVLVASRHFASFFLGLEILTVALYGLIAYLREGGSGVEAGVKYLILSAVSDSFLLFGMALIYAQSGTMEFARLAQLAVGGELTLVLPGTVLLITGIGFKLSLVPFHMWTPDVYEGAPSPVTALLATVSKVAVFALLLRYCAALNLQSQGAVATVLATIAMASMIVGNLLALLQTNVKRVLAYSSIAHMGYVLVALLAGGKTALAAVGYYLAAYSLTTVGAFGVIAVLSGPEREADRMEDFQGLAWRRPLLAGVFTVMLLSLAGIPLTAGFVGKFYVMVAGVGSSLWLMVITLVVTSVIGLFYYLRIVAHLFVSPESERVYRLRSAPSPLGVAVLVVLTVLLVWWGVFPSQLIEIIEKTVAVIGA